MKNSRVVQNINSVIDKRKITSLLRMEQQINHKRVQRIMQREGLQCRVKVKKRKPTGQPAHVVEHMLMRQFQEMLRCKNS
ncbi:IS3 family transposase, partial [Paenibacillus alvei]|uniref:IS3 family transposase n=1 Tax=Paenibacillus alvei TaxID=44250 RepID=UPI003D2A7EA4